MRHQMDDDGQKAMHASAAWYVGLTTLAVAAVLSYGSDPSGVAVLDTGNVAASVSVPLSASENTSTIEIPALLELVPSRETLHWPSLWFGLVIGIVLAFASQVRWLELPRRMVDWLVTNERNFYRVGLVGVCLAVLLYY